MINTERCIVRCFEEKDLDSFMTYRNNDEWMKYQGFKNLTKDEYRESLLVPFDLKVGAQLAIVDKVTDGLLGDIYLCKEEDEISIGYTINPIYSRKGYISEVLKGLLAKLKEDYPSCKIVATTEKENIPSKNLLLKLGFVYDGWEDQWQEEVYIYWSLMSLYYLLIVYFRWNMIYFNHDKMVSCRKVFPAFLHIITKIRSDYMDTNTPKTNFWNILCASTPYKI